MKSYDLIAIGTGSAMNVVQAVLQRETGKKIVNLMYTEDRSPAPILGGMHIHPAQSEVVERAFLSLMPAEHYDHLMEENRL